jgi:uncharacterized protein (TIGR02453 family)
MDTKIIYTFLKDLNDNNSLDWMRNNKNYYEEAKGGFENLMQELINGITEYDNSVRYLVPKDLIFRLNPDTPFSNDKSPYNPSFRDHISSAGRTPIPARYYINIKPEKIFLGGGLFVVQFPAATKNDKVFYC